MLSFRPKTARDEGDSDVHDNRAKMSRPTTAILLFLLILSSPAARAGPTWMESVLEEPDYFFGGSRSLIDIYVSPFTGSGCGIATFDNGRGLSPTMYGVLLDYQGSPGPINLYVNYAAWGFDTSNTPSFDVPLDVYSYPSSPNPPSSINMDLFRELGSPSIPVGDYWSSPYPITLQGSADAGGGVCLLLQAGFVEGLGTSSMSFNFSSSSVPEPSSWLSLGTAMAGLAIIVWHGSIRRRTASRRCAREVACDSPGRARVTA